MLKRQYIPLGCDQQSRLVPTKLTGRSLDLQIAAKNETRDIGELLLAGGAMEGPFKRPRQVLNWPGRFARFLREALDEITKPCID